MPAALQVWPVDPVAVAVVVLLVAVVVLAAVVRRLRRNGSTEQPDAEPMRADAPRGRVCPDCNEVNPMDAGTCQGCGRTFGIGDAVEGEN